MISYRDLDLILVLAKEMVEPRIKHWTFLFYLSSLKTSHAALGKFQSLLVITNGQGSKKFEISVVRDEKEMNCKEHTANQAESLNYQFLR